MGGREGSVLDSEEEAKEVIADHLTSPSKKATLALLASHVSHTPYRKSTLVAKDLLYWLQQPNSVRTFLFLKAQGLKDLMDARGVEVAPGSRSTVANMIQALAKVESAPRATRGAAPATANPPRSRPMQEEGGLDPKDDAT